MLLRSFEAIAAAEMLETGAFLSETGGTLAVAGLATSETGVGLMAVPAGGFIATNGVVVFLAGTAVTADLVGFWDLGVVPPPCSAGGRSSR